MGYGGDHVVFFIAVELKVFLLKFYRPYFDIFLYWKGICRKLNSKEFYTLVFRM